MRRAAIVSLVLLAGACGSSEGSEAEGRQVFATAGCGTCHTLRDAGATGTVGPNLDNIQPGKPVVEMFVRNGSRQMPSFRATLTEEQIEAVADYVSSAAGRAE